MPCCWFFLPHFFLLGLSVVVVAWRSSFHVPQTPSWPPVRPLVSLIFSFFVYVRCPLFFCFPVCVCVAVHNSVSHILIYTVIWNQNKKRQTVRGGRGEGCCHEICFFSSQQLGTPRYWMSFCLSARSRKLDDDAIGPHPSLGYYKRLPADCSLLCIRSHSFFLNLTLSSHSLYLYRWSPIVNNIVFLDFFFLGCPRQEMTFQLCFLIDMVVHISRTQILEIVTFILKKYT